MPYRALRSISYGMLHPSKNKQFTKLSKHIDSHTYQFYRSINDEQ